MVSFRITPTGALIRSVGNDRAFVKVSVQLLRSRHDALKIYAANANKSVSSVVNTMIVRYLSSGS